MSFYCCTDHRGIFCINAIHAKKRHLIYTRYYFKVDFAERSSMKSIQVRECSEIIPLIPTWTILYTTQIDHQNDMVMASLRQVYLATIYKRSVEDIS